MTRRNPIGIPPRKQADRERALLAAAWFDPVQLARGANQLGLNISDFRDRLCGVVVRYLRDCGESGRVPTLAGAEAALDEFAVPRDSDELFFLLIDTAVSDCDSFADLIRDVLREADDRAEQLCRDLTRDALRTLKHAFECPRCIACARGHRRRTGAPVSKAIARRVVYA